MIKVLKGAKGVSVFVADLWIDGRRKRPRFATKAVAQAWLDETKHKVRHGEHVLTSADVWNFEAAAKAFYDARQDRRPRTLVNYKRALWTYLVPRFGSYRLDRITVEDLEKFRHELLITRKLGKNHTTRKRSTVELILKCASQVFRYAIHTGHCARNPIQLMERLHASSPELGITEHPVFGDTASVPVAAVPSAAQVRHLVDSLTGLPKVFVTLAVMTGSRESELLALLWRDLDIEDVNNGKMRVERSLTWDGDGYHIHQPKTKAGTRTLPLPPLVVRVLRQWAGSTEYSVAEDPDNAFVFPASEYARTVKVETGGPRHNGTILHAMRKAGSKLRLHSLRHFYASVLIADGLPVTTVQHLLGHKDASITLRVYAHFFDRQELDTNRTLKAVAALENLMKSEG